MNTKGKIFIVVVVGAVLFWLLMFGPLAQYVGRGPAKSVVPLTADLPSAVDGEDAAHVAKTEMPSSTLLTKGKKVKTKLWAWNSQMGEMYANGGVTTTRGSLMEKSGMILTLERLDDAEKMKSDLLTFAEALQSNPNPQVGAHFVQIMGDGAAAFLAGIAKPLSKLGSDNEYRAVIVGSCGFSRGEDKLLGPEIWRSSPDSMRGCVIAGYLRDGDWNIALKYAGDNGILNNPDETTYDPNAVNWVAASDYIDAVMKYVQGYSEERPIVINGKKTGQTKKIKVQGVVTWTPGDVIVAQKKGGLISVVSTKEYAAQMPNAIIGINKWCVDNRPLVEGMLEAIFAGGEQVKAYPEALQRAAEISDKVYQEKGTGPAYWIKYYKGVTERDKQGMMVELGGSKVNTLADNIILFGPQELFKAPYVIFGNIVHQQYPKLVPTYPTPEEAIDGSYVMALANRAPTTQTADEYTFDAAPAVNEVMGKRTYSGKDAILFRTGSDEISPGQEEKLEEIKNQLAVSLSLKVVIHGHTDNVGDPQMNMELSTRRAKAVKTWLETKAPGIFPYGRISVIGHGEEAPIAANDTEAGRSKNRRVEVITGTVDH